MKKQLQTESVVDRLLCQTEVQHITGLSASSLEQWRRHNKGIPYVKLGTKSIRYRESAVVAYCASLTEITGKEQS